MLIKEYRKTTKKCTAGQQESRIGPHQPTTADKNIFRLLRVVSQGNAIADLVCVKPMCFVNVTAHDYATLEGCESRFYAPYSPYADVDADHEAGRFYALL
jgi:hypothetical protein